MSTPLTPAQSIDAAARRLVDLRRLARLERKELGAVSVRTRLAIAEACAAAEAACAVDDAKRAVGSSTGSTT